MSDIPVLGVVTLKTLMELS